MHYTTEEQTAIPILPLQANQLADFLADQTESVSKWIENSDFTAKPHQYCIVPAASGEIAMVLVGLHENPDEVEAAAIWSIANLAKELPVAHYELVTDWPETQMIQAEIGWGLGAYRFDFFKRNFLEQPEPQARLKVAESRLPVINAYVDAITMVRDLVNTPANHMMPEDLAELSQDLCLQHGAEFKQIVGDELLDENFPAIHAVGRASEHAPRLIQINWSADASNADLPLLTLVGKGVCFDTGGLDIKPSKFMRNMKKDMGGAAHALGLAHLIMSLQLPVKLEVLISAVDNAISGDAYRPGDIIDTRARKTIEIDNTDAEGRVVLCDALTLACEHQSDLILDFATLTGAARVAVGTEIPALFTNAKKLQLDMQNPAYNLGEIIWPLPLHEPYRYQLDSAVADMANASSESYGGAITAALYLKEFVDESIDWAHFDMMAWNTRERPGRPKGGEAMGLLVAFDYLQRRYQST